MSDALLHLGGRRGFLQRTLAELSALLELSATADESARKSGLLQSLDARVKLAAAVLLIVAATASHHWEVMLGVMALGVLLATASGLPMRRITRVWLSALLFTGIIALPALVLTPGPAVAVVPGTAWPITATGLRSAGFLLGRVLATTTICSALMLSTPWHHLLKAMRVFRLPVVAVVLIGTTYRYIFLFVQLAMDMMESKRSRVAAPLPSVDRRRMAIASAGVLMSKAFELNSEVHLAMQARGYRHEVYLLDELSMRARDWFAAFLVLSASLAALAFLTVRP
ncbi:MAG: energy-coupling factor transporter transmembrane component T [Acidobacteriota bacterium]